MCNFSIILKHERKLKVHKKERKSNINIKCFPVGLLVVLEKKMKDDGR